MKNRVKECEEYRSDREIVLEENNKKITFFNPNRDKILVIRVDNCVIKSQEQNKCDYALIPCESVEIYVELKGKDVPHAIKQIESTINLLSEDPKKIKKYCFVVSSKVFRYSTDIRNSESRFKKKYNAVLKVKNTQHSYNLSDI